MGSFTELTLAFTFARDTPPEIIGAFAEWRTDEEHVEDRAPAPELPALETSFGDNQFDADMYLGNYFDEDPANGLTSLQQAALCQYMLGWPDNAYSRPPPAPRCAGTRTGSGGH
jgi:hypothetical protein